MENWNKISASIGSLNIGQGASKFAKSVSSSYQATRERLGTIPIEDITELPQEYKELEARVDALKAAHLAMIRIGQVYATPYDYPTQVQESLTETASNVSHAITSFAAANLKGTNIPTPAVTPQAVHQPKTLPHAIARASAGAAAGLGPENRLSKGLTTYSRAYEKIGEARLNQDDAILEHFVLPWQASLNNSIALANKARQAVRNSRLELDSAKQSLKNAGPARQEQARLEVENAEDDLVQKTEVAISLMKTVLENPEPLKNLNEFCKAQLLFHSAAAEALHTAQGELEELSVAAEGEYRKSRDH